MVKIELQCKRTLIFVLHLISSRPFVACASLTCMWWNASCFVFFGHVQNLGYFPEIHIWIHTSVSVAFNSVFRTNFYRKKLMLKKYFWWCSVCLPAQHCGIAVSLPGKHSSVQYPLSTRFFFYIPLFFSWLVLPLSSYSWPFPYALHQVAGLSLRFPVWGLRVCQ